MASGEGWFESRHVGDYHEDQDEHEDEMRMRTEKMKVTLLSVT